MPRIELETHIQAPIERVFDLARDIDFHQKSQAHKGERAVAGVKSGLIELGDWVTWEAKHFGIRQQLTSKITRMQAPDSFRDSMLRGAFASFDHDHLFRSDGQGGTLMTDVFCFESPGGPLGHLANRLFLTRYMTQLLEERNLMLKATAEEQASA